MGRAPPHHMAYVQPGMSVSGRCVPSSAMGEAAGIAVQLEDI